MEKWHPLVISVVFSLIAIVAKLLSRRDGDASPKRNDCYVGQAQVLGAMSAATVYLVKAVFLVKTAHLETHVKTAVNLVIISVVLLLLVLTMAVVDRYFAWTTDQVAGPGGVETTVYRRTVPVGILVPNSLGFLCFTLVFLFAKYHSLVG